MLRRQIHCRLTHTSRQCGGKDFEIFPQNACLPQVLFHQVIIETSKRALQSQSIPTVQNSDDIAFVTLYKGMRNLFRKCIRCIVDTTTVYTNETNLSFWLRLCRAGLFVSFVVNCMCLYRPNLSKIAT